MFKGRGNVPEHRRQTFSTRGQAVSTAGCAGPAASAATTQAGHVASEAATESARMWLRFHKTSLSKPVFSFGPDAALRSSYTKLYSRVVGLMLSESNRTLLHLRQRRQEPLLLEAGGEPRARQLPSEAPESPVRAAKAEFGSRCPASPQKASSFRWFLTLNGYPAT